MPTREAGTGTRPEQAVRRTGHPALALAAVCYTAFLYLLRRGGSRGSPVRKYVVVIAVAGLVSLVVGALWRGVLGERPTVVQLAGCALILAGAYLGTRAERPPRAA